MSKFKFGEKSVILVLLEKNTYMRYEKFNMHKEDSIGLLNYFNTFISLQRTTRKKTDVLMLVHLNDNEMTAMTNISSENAVKPSEEKRTHHPGI